jgi:hypothetical protein
VSREDQSSLKRALFVYAGLATLFPIVAIGWFAHSAISSIEKNSNAAIARVEQSVQSIRETYIDHAARDGSRDEALAARVSRIETENGAILRLRLSSDRELRRPTAVAPRGTP